mmetsp:Transcript_26601/g.42765  ORF Transcript_26601/g.42765 Transcript_26601/m.42765 type:complete len:359 (-) Transcript_26601:90-1166(-)
MTIDCDEDGLASKLPPRYSNVDVGLTIALYMFANAGVSISQKLAVSTIPLPFFLVALQVLATLILLIPFATTIKMGSLEDARKFLPISCGFFFMLVGSMIAYQYCTLGTIVVVGSISPLITLAIEKLYFVENRIRLSWHTFASLTVTVSGVILYGAYKSELEAQLIGMFALVLKIIVAILYQTRQRYLMVEDPVDISDTGMMVYNNVVTFIGTLFCIVPFGEHTVLMDLNPSAFGIFAVTASCIFSGLIGYVAFRTQRRVSATSFLIVTNVCKVAVVLFGWLILKESYNWQSGTGCVLVMIGAAWYGWDRRTISARDNGVSTVRAQRANPEDFGLLEEAEWIREKHCRLEMDDSERDF